MTRAYRAKANKPPFGPAIVRAPTRLQIAERGPSINSGILMIPTDRTWFRQPGASEKALQDLRAGAEINLPAEYFDLLAYSNGGEGPISVQPYNFCLDPAERSTMRWISKECEAFFPGFFMFGGTGGGDYIAFDLRGAQPWPVVAIDMTNIDLPESVMLIAKDFSLFLSLVGIEAANA